MEGEEALQKSEPKPAPASRSPFNHRFFQIIFPNRLQGGCEGHSDEIPVVLLRLADERELDLCHIELLEPGWMAVAVFRVPASCDDMDTVFVPYEMITGVTLSHRDAKVRRLGFQTDRSVPEVLRTPPAFRARETAGAGQRRA